MYIKFKTKEFATEFVNTIKKNKDKSYDLKEFGIWESCFGDIEENGISISYLNENQNKYVTVNIFIDEDIENQVVINTYEEYDLMYAPLFYNEYKQLLYRNYFIGE
nr:MAG TPA: hypothetical protein [Caudoviricetes sp.]